MKLTGVYICSGKDGEAVYVGFSSNLLQRIAAHATSSFWWQCVVSVSFRLFDDTDSARKEEAAIIKQIRPRFNTNHAKTSEEMAVKKSVSMSPELWDFIEKHARDNSMTVSGAVQEALLIMQAEAMEASK